MYLKQRGASDYSLFRGGYDLRGTGDGTRGVQRLVLAIAGVRWPYTPDVLPPFGQGG